MCRKRVGARRFELPAFSGYLNPNPRMVGLEVEIGEYGEFINHARPKHFEYALDHDGSVRPSQQEMVLMPMRGDHLLLGIRDMVTQLQGYGARANDTCGFHVHVDASDFNLWHIRRLLQMYANIEPTLYDTMVPPNRRHSQYCRTLQGPTLRMLKAMHRASTSHDLKIAALTHMYTCTEKALEKKSSREIIRVRNDEWNRLKSSKYIRNDSIRNIRYQGLNLHSWFFRGSVEFRMWPGTTDLTDMSMWSLWCAWFVENAANWTDTYAMNAGWDQVIGGMPKGVQDWVKVVQDRYRGLPTVDPPPEPTAYRTPALDRIRARLREVAEPGLAAYVDTSLFSTPRPTANVSNTWGGRVQYRPLDPAELSELFPTPTDPEPDDDNDDEEND